MSEFKSGLEHQRDISAKLAQIEMSLGDVNWHLRNFSPNVQDLASTIVALATEAIELQEIALNYQRDHATPITLPVEAA